MAKALKVAAIVVGAVALTVATAGIGSAAAFSVTTLGVTSTVAATGASLFGISAGTLMLASSALSVASGLAAKKPALGSSGVQTAFKADPNAGIPYLIGRTGSGGNIVFRSNADGWSDKTPNDLNDFNIVHSLGPIQGYESFRSDQTVVTFDANGNANGAYRNFMFHKSQLGACPEPAALAVTAGSSARPSGWATSAKLSGLAAAQWRLRFDAKGEHYQNGTPKPQWIVLGVKVYDPRLDSSYPGGSGTCRSDDEATWVYSQNPYLHGLTWLIGRHQNGQRVMGVGMPINGIIVSSFVEGANIADANSWKVGGVVYSTDNKYEVLKAILQAGGGEPMRLGAQIGCLINTPRVSLATITIDDLAQGEVSVQATQPQRSRINAVIARYRSEDHDWEIVPAAPVRVAAYETEDGGQRTREIEYPLVQVAAGQPVVQPAQLARYDIQNAREFGPISIPLKLRWMGYRPGDCLTANLPESNLNNQLILLLNRGLEPGSGVVTITARSETTAKHAFALGQTTTPPPTPSVSGPPLVPTPASGDWAITDTSISSGGVTVPALRVAGTAPTSIETIVFEYRVYTGPGMDPEAGWAAAGMEPPQATAKTITTVASGTAYQVSVRYRTRGTSGGRLILGPATSSAYGGVTGGTGPAGLSNKIVEIYQRSSSGAPPLPSATATYDFGTLTLSGLNNGWSATIPGGTGTLYISAATASSNTGSDTIAAGEWSGAVVWASQGLPGDPGMSGLNSATVTLWQRNNTGVAPPAPSVTTTYTFSTGALATPNNGWTQAAPDPSGGEFVFVTTATALAAATSPNDTIAAGEWAAPKQFVKDGDKGDDGDPGISPLALSASPSTVVIKTDENGFPAAGQLPRTVQFKALYNGVDVTSAITWPDPSLTDVGAVSLGGGAYRIDGIGADQGSFGFSVTYAGQSVPTKVEVTKAPAGAPAQRAKAASLAAPGLSYGVAATLQLNVTPDVIVTMSAGCSYTMNIPGGGRVQMKLYYRNVTDGGAFVQVGPEVIGENAIRYGGTEPPDPVIGSASSGALTVPAPSSTKIYEFQLTWARTNDLSLLDRGFSVSIS